MLTVSETPSTATVARRSRTSSAGSPVAAGGDGGRSTGAASVRRLRARRRRGGLGPEHVLDDLRLAALGGHERADVVAVAQDRRAVAERDHLGEAVRDEEHGAVLLLQLAGDLEDALGEVGRKCRRDLVQQEQLRLTRERAREVEHAQHRQRQVAGLVVEVERDAHVRQALPARPRSTRP